MNPGLSDAITQLLQLLQERKKERCTNLGLLVGSAHHQSLAEKVRTKLGMGGVRKPDMGAAVGMGGKEQRNPWDFEREVERLGVKVMWVCEGLHL